jgi:phage-related baseplate assembly protein
MPDLPDVVFAEGDARIIANKLKTLYEAVRRAGGEPAYRLAPADPERLVQLTEAALLAQVNADIDATGKGNLLYYAGEETIEHLGYLYGRRGTRLAASAAVTTIRYTLAVPREAATVIPAGYRVTPDNKIFFATVAPLEIPPGVLTGDAEARSLETGAAGNGFLPGEIKNMVDLPPFVSSAVNVTTSAGGADKESVEAYRARIRILPESFSVAGPTGAYEFWAYTANPGIADVKAWMPDLDFTAWKIFLSEILAAHIPQPVPPDPDADSQMPVNLSDEEAAAWRKRFNEIVFETGTGPGNVNVAVLMQNGKAPEGEVLGQVYDVLNDIRVRPLTDWVHVITPSAAEYNIDFKYWILKTDAVYSLAIAEAVDGAVKDYIKWQSSELGTDINPSKLHEFIMNAGVKRLEITEPVFTPLKEWEVAKLIDLNVVYEGLEDV